MGRHWVSAALVVLLCACGSGTPSSPAKETPASSTTATVATEPTLEIQGLRFHLPGWQKVSASSCQDDSGDEAPVATHPTAIVGRAVDLRYCWLESAAGAPVAIFGQDGPPDLSGGDLPPSEVVEVAGVSFEMSAGPSYDTGSEALALLKGWQAWIEVSVPGTTGDALDLVRSIVRTLERPAASRPPKPLRQSLVGDWSHHNAMFVIHERSAELTMTSGCCYPILTLEFETRPMDDGIGFVATVTNIRYLEDEGKSAPPPSAADGGTDDTVGDEYEFTLAARGLLKMSLVRSAAGEPLQHTPNEYFCGDGIEEGQGYNCGA